MKKLKNNTLTRICLSLLATGSWSSAASGDLLYSLTAATDHRELGSGFAAVGDLDADGVTDVAVADRSSKVASYLGSGIVHVVSGKTGSILRSYEGEPKASQSFGASLVALDADGDDIPDLAVGSPGQADASGFGAGAVRIYSGLDGSLLITLPGPSKSQLGASLANAGDQDGDGLDDLYVGAPMADTGKGGVYVMSSQTGAILRTISTTASTSGFGVGLRTLGDIDGDGLNDVAIAAPAFKVGRNEVGRVVLVRSSDGAVAAQIVGTLFYNRLGESLAVVADANGDGSPDLLVGSYSGGSALLVSGVDFSTLADLSIPSLPAYQKLTVGGGLDFDLDGTADWLIGSPALQGTGNLIRGGIRVVSGLDQSTLFESIAAGPYTGLGVTLAVLPGLGIAAGEAAVKNPATGGNGLAHVWEVLEISDSDGDGVVDDLDTNPFSNMDASVIFNGVDTGIPNRVDAGGVTLADRYAELGPISGYPNPTQFMVKATQLSTQLQRDELITRDEFKQIHAAALEASVKRDKRR